MADYKKLYSLLCALPPDLNAIEQDLINSHYTAEDVTLAACEFCNEQCFCEYTDFIEAHSREPLEEEIHTSYVYAICELLLKYGLNPNMVLGEKLSETNLMFELKFIDKPYVAADTLRLLIMHGADPLTELEDNSVYNSADFDIWFDVTEGYYKEDFYATRFDCKFHYWLVLLGAVAKEEEYKKNYLNHENYSHVITRTDKDRWEIGVKTNDSAKIITTY